MNRFAPLSRYLLLTGIAAFGAIAGSVNSLGATSTVLSVVAGETPDGLASAPRVTLHCRSEGLEALIGIEPDEELPSVGVVYAALRFDKGSPLKAASEDGRVFAIQAPGSFIRKIRTHDELTARFTHLGDRRIFVTFDLRGIRDEIPALLNECNADDGVETGPDTEPSLPGTDGVSSPVRIEASAVKPVYPEFARLTRSEGRVILQATIPEDGSVRRIEILSCNKPDVGFEEAAKDAVRQWRYEPAMLDGKPVEVYFTIVVEFSLNDDDEDDTTEGARDAGSSAPAEHVFEELNFRFAAPREPWIQMDVSTFNAAASLGFMRTAPSMGFMIIADNSNPALGETDTGSLAEIYTTGLRSALSDAKVISKEPVTLNGMDGVRVVTHGRMGTIDLAYVSWTYSRNGFAYQLVAWGDYRMAPAEKILEFSQEMFERFDLIDPDRLSRPEGGADVDLRFERFGVRVDLAGTSWKNWPEVGEALESAPIGGWIGANSVFAIVPVSIGPHEISLDGLAESLLAEMEFDFPSAEIEAVDTVEDSTSPAYDIRARRSFDGVEFVYWLRIVKTAQYGYMVAVWTQAGDAPLESLFESVIQGVSIDPAYPADPDEPLEFGGERQGYILGRIAYHHYELSDFVTSAALYARAFKAAPHESEILYGWISSVNSSVGAAEALELYLAHATGMDDDLALRSWGPFLHAMVGDYETAVREYEPLFAKGYRETEDLVTYVHSLQQLGRQDEAIEFLTERYTGPPFNATLAMTLAESYEEIGGLTEAIRVCDEMLARGHKKPDIYFLKGRAEHGLGSYREAKASLEEAARRNPAGTEIKEYLAFVSGLLGEGANTALKTVIEPVPLPERWISEDPSDESPEGAEDFGVYYVSRVAAISYTPEKDFRTTERILAKILDRRGATRMKTLMTEYDPFIEEIHINALRVLDESGQVVSEGDPADYYVVDGTSEPAASQKRIVHLPVKALEPGSTIELTVTRRRLTPPTQLPYFSHYFAYHLPTTRSSIVLGGTIDHVAHVEDNGVEFRTGENELIWTAESVKIARAEPYAAPPMEYLPFVKFKDAAASWKEVGASYLQDISETLEPDASVARLTERLTSEIQDPQERTRVLVEHVQRQLDYEAIAFGKRAWIPNAVAEIVRAGTGDCKDHALLLYQMLQAQGLPARLALVNSSGPIVRDLPSLDQFDHMIVYVPGLRNGGFIDTTDKGHDLLLLPPAGLGKSWALILDEESSKLKEIPDYPPDSGVNRSDRLIEVADDGELRIDDTLSLEGYAAIGIRGALRDADSRTQQMIVQQVLSTWHRGVRVDEVSTENLATASLPLLLKVRYRIKGMLIADQGRLYGRFPGVWVRSLLVAPHLEERISPVWIQSPAMVASRITVKPPPGYSLAELSADKRKGKDPFFTWTLDSDVRDGTIEMRYELRRRPGKHPSESYRELQHSVDQLLGLIEPHVRYEGTVPLAELPE